jgi:hypothetical protein
MLRLLNLSAVARTGLIFGHEKFPSSTHRYGYLLIGLFAADRSTIPLEKPNPEYWYYGFYRFLAGFRAKR